MLFILEAISHFALDTISRFGYGGVFLLSALESAAIPIPSEVVVPFSGFLAATGRFNLWVVAFVATAANLTGSVVLFFIGKSGGRWILERYGKYVLIHKKDLDLGDEWFQKHGMQAVFFSRMLPVVRTFISLPAGIARINFLKFMVFTFLGALPWNFMLAFIGFKAGENWNILHGYFRKFDFVIVGVLIGLVGWYIVRHIKQKRQHKQD